MLLKRSTSPSGKTKKIMNTTRDTPLYKQPAYFVDPARFINRSWSLKKTKKIIVITRERTIQKQKEMK